MKQNHVIIAAVSSILLFHTSTARADVPGKIDLFHAVDDGTQALSAFLAGPTAASQAGQLGARPLDDRLEGSECRRATCAPTDGRDVPVSSAPSAADPDVSLLPRPSLLLRDWRESFVIAGAPALVVDAIRPLASNRVALVRLTTPPIETRHATLSVSPFVQAGAGEWRIDPVIIPALPGASSFAGQVGGGLEITVARQVQIAAEGQTTYLYGAQPWSGDVTLPRVFSGVVALRARF